MITLWNTGDAAEDILVRFWYADGTSRYTLPVHLPAMGSRTIDLWRLIAANRPDRKGRSFAMEEQSGSLSFESAVNHATWLRLNAEVAVYNPATGTCGCYCDPCCAYTDFGLSPQVSLLYSSQDETVWAVACYCTGQEEVMGVDQVTTTIISVVTWVNPSTGKLEVIGGDPGTTTSDVYFSAVIVGGVNCYGYQDTSNCQSAPVVVEQPTTVTECGDPPSPKSGDRGPLIQEYAAYAVDLSPQCSDFTNSASTPDFSFGEWTVSDDYTWAILRSSLLNGAEAIRGAYGGPLVISSGYRNPAHNAAVGGAAQSQHMYGTAVDFATGGNLMLWSNLQTYAWNAGACVEPQLRSTLSHLHADWRAGGCPPLWGPDGSGTAPGGGGDL